MHPTYIAKSLADEKQRDMFRVADRHRLAREAGHRSVLRRSPSWMACHWQSFLDRLRQRRLSAAFQRGLAGAVTSAGRQELLAASMRSDWQPFADARRMGGC